MQRELELERECIRGFSASQAPHDVENVVLWAYYSNKAFHHQLSQTLLALKSATSLTVNSLHSRAEFISRLSSHIFQLKPPVLKDLETKFP